MLNLHVASATRSFVRCDPVTRYQGCMEFNAWIGESLVLYANMHARLPCRQLLDRHQLIKELVALCNAVARLAFLSGVLTDESRDKLKCCA